eukprot:sb/3471960/
MFALRVKCFMDLPKSKEDDFGSVYSFDGLVSKKKVPRAPPPAFNNNSRSNSLTNGAAVTGQSFRRFSVFSQPLGGAANVRGSIGGAQAPLLTDDQDPATALKQFQEQNNMQPSQRPSSDFKFRSIVTEHFQAAHVGSGDLTSSEERVLGTKSGWSLNRGQITLISYIGGNLCGH